MESVAEPKKTTTELDLLRHVERSASRLLEDLIGESDSSVALKYWLERVRDLRNEDAEGIDHD